SRRPPPFPRFPYTTLFRSDPDRLAVLHGDAADRRELLVTPAAGADVARVDPVLVQGPRHRGVAGQEQVAVVVEVADERGRAAGRSEEHTSELQSRENLVCR